MNIALCTNTIFLGGRTSHIIALTEEYIKLGHKVYIFTAGCKQPHPECTKRVELLEHLGAEIVKIHFPNNSINKISFKLKFLGCLVELPALFKAKKIDVVHLHQSNSIFPLLFHFMRRKYVKTAHSHLKYLDPRCRATQEIAISKEIYKDLKKEYHYHDDEITLIYNGVSTRFSTPTSEERIFNLKDSLQLPKDKIIIGIVGALNKNKGHDILLSAINQIEENLKKRIHIAIVGQAPTEKDSKWIAHLLHSHSLAHPQYISRFDYGDPKPFYDTFDILVSPSRSEGFPLVPIEAMLSGCCVIRSNVEGATQQIKDGKTGFLFESENSTELGALIKKLVENQGLRKEVAQNGRTYALKHFTSESMAKKTLEVYQKVIAST